MKFNMTNSDTQSQVQSQQMSWHARYYIISKGSLWDLAKKYNIIHNIINTSLTCILLTTQGVWQFAKKSPYDDKGFKNWKNLRTKAFDNKNWLLAPYLHYSYYLTFLRVESKYQTYRKFGLERKRRKTKIL